MSKIDELCSELKRLEAKIERLDVLKADGFSVEGFSKELSSDDIIAIEAEIKSSKDKLDLLITEVCLKLV